MIDLTGERYSRLLVLAEVARQGKHRMWRCLCDCGTERVVSANNLRMRRTLSCGCLSGQLKSERSWLHGLCGTGAHTSWRQMMNRCTNENSPSYASYGGAGITVCERWKLFANFYADMGERPTKHSIDRIDTQGNYELENCRWATAREQRMNQARGSITMEQAQQVRHLRAEHGWGPNTIAKHLGISNGASSGVIYLGNLQP